MHTHNMQLMYTHMHTHTQFYYNNIRYMSTDAHVWMMPLFFYMLAGLTLSKQERGLNYVRTKGDMW
jgi:hypothetical protein